MARSTKSVQREQTRQHVARAGSFAGLRRPAQGWISTVRTALGMSGVALSRRMGGGRTMAANLERYEREERTTLRSMRIAAEAMGCRFVYAIVPPEGHSIESLIEAQALHRAKALTRAASIHMSLEAQQLDAESTLAEIDRLKRELMLHQPRDFWDPDNDG